MQTINQPNPVGRRTYIAGSIAFIAIGALHTAVHFAQLRGTELKARFDAFGDIDVSGDMEPAWNLFQATSILMGLYGIALGVINLFALRAAKNGRPPVGICLATIAMLVGIIVVAIPYLGAMQLYGSMVGIICFGMPAVQTLRANAQDGVPSNAALIAA